MPTRREFLGQAMLVPSLPSLWVGTYPGYRWRHDDVLGTSMELTVWARNQAAADAAHHAAWAEIDRLDAVLSTYRPDSEISQHGSRRRPTESVELARLLDLYSQWGSATNGALSNTIARRLNVDALGKAFIVDLIVSRLRGMGSDLQGVLLNIGGDIAAAGVPAIVDVVNPRTPEENAAPVTSLAIRDKAIATSGTYARGQHIVDPRTGNVARRGAVAATVVAADCVSANALATALCVMGPEDGLALVARTPGAEALLVTASGLELRSGGFDRFERPTRAASPTPAAWPEGHDVRIALTLTGGGGTASRGGQGGRGGRGRRVLPPYVAIWAADAAGKPIRTIAVWGDKWRYLSELPQWWSFAKNDSKLNTTSTRATRPAGEYSVAWNGLDDNGAAVPEDTYTIHVEVSREHGSYAERSGQVLCKGTTPATITLPESAEFAPVVVTYGPRGLAS